MKKEDYKYFLCLLMIVFTLGVSVVIIPHVKSASIKPSLTAKRANKIHNISQIGLSKLIRHTHVKQKNEGFLVVFYIMVKLKEKKQ